VWELQGTTYVHHKPCIDSTSMDFCVLLCVQLCMHATPKIIGFESKYGFQGVKSLALVHPVAEVAVVQPTVLDGQGLASNCHKLQQQLKQPCCSCCGLAWLARCWASSRLLVC